MNEGCFPRRSQETQEAASTLSRRRQERRLASGGILDAAGAPRSSGEGWLGLDPFPEFGGAEARRLSTTRTNNSFAKNPAEFVLLYSARAISRAKQTTL
jgi:hypothetical protein